MDKIEFEEWALKSIDTNLAPKPWKRIVSKTAKGETKEGETAPLKSSMYEPVSFPSRPLFSISTTLGLIVLRDALVQVELIFPPSLLKPEALLEQLEKQLKHREPHHRKSMWKCLM